LADTLSDLVTYELAGNITFRVFRHPILKDIANVGYAALPATIAAKGDVLRRYSRAIVEAALFIRTNPRAAARLYLQNQVGGLKVTGEAVRDTARELALLQDFLPAGDPSNKRIGLLPPQGLELYSRYLADFGMIPRPVPGAAVATDRFVPYANDFDHRAVRALARRMP
jgi:ABC-type nitrate/sulfonate/bicarbonate transport system substrate-binding protein